MGISINRELDVVNYEDISHLSALWSRPGLINSEIRQSANILRRLLHHKEIQGSTSPRALKLSFNSPDNKALVRCAQNGHLNFFQSGGTTVLGVWFRASTVTQYPAKMEEALRGFDPESVIPLKLDSFLDQPVFFFDGTFVTRRSVLLYVANKAGGTHFDKNRPEEFSILDRIRAAQTIKLVDDIPSFGFDIAALHEVGENFTPSIGGIDSVFIELASAIRHFTESPSVVQLMATLKNELGL